MKTFLIIFVLYIPILFGQYQKYIKIDDKQNTNVQLLVDTKYGIIATNEIENILYLINNNDVIVLVNAPGCGRYINLSYDKRYIGFKYINANNGLQIPAIIDLEDKSIKYLDKPSKYVGQVSFTIDGKISYMYENNFIIIDKNNYKKVVKPLNYYNNAIISPNGDKFIYKNSNNIIIQEIYTNKIQKIEFNNELYDFKWSNNSEYLLAKSVNSDIFLIDINKNEFEFITKGNNYNWNSNGYQFLYTSTHFDIKTNRIDKTEIYEYNVANKTKEKIINSSDNHITPIYSYDKSTVYSVSEGNIYKLKDNKVIEKIIIKEKINNIISKYQNLFYKYNKEKNASATIYKAGNHEWVHIHQVYDTREDWDQGRVCCGSTSAMQVFATYNILQPWPMTVYGHTSNYGKYISNSYTYNGYTYSGYTGRWAYGAHGYLWNGDGSPYSNAVNLFKRHGIIDVFRDEAVTFSKVKSNHLEGNAYYLCSTGLTSGHIVLSVGYYGNYNTLVVNDPYGDKNAGSYGYIYNGKYSIYDWGDENTGHVLVTPIAWGVEINYQTGVVLSSPSDGSKHLGITPTMSWQSYSGASSYQLQVSTSSTFSSTVINQSGITGTSYTVGSNILNYGVTYYWRVKANNSSEWSSVWEFTTSGMKPLVEKKSSNNSLPSWFGGASTDNTERGIAYTGNEILVVSRKGSVSIRRLKWDDLSDIGTLNIDGVSGGTYILNDIETSWDGKILACNLVINNTQTFKIYKWDNVTSTAVEYISYVNTSGYRLGDNFTVYGSLSSNAAIYVPAGNNNKILKWTVSNGVLNSTPQEITLSLPSGVTQLNSPVSIAPYGYGNENFYVNAPNVNPILYNSSGAIQGTIDGGVIPQASTTIKTFVVGGKRYLMAFLSNNTAGDPNGQNLIIVDVTNGPSAVGSGDIYGKSIRLGDVSNSNMAGDLCYRAVDGKYTVYVLATNNGIGAYECMSSPLPVELAEGSFKGYLTGNGVKLEWVTLSELNNDRFEIERLDKGEWKKIGEILGQGTSNTSKRYEFEDKQIERQRVIRYRLKQVDNDGSYKYVGELELNGLNELKYELKQNYPNPFNPSTRISYRLAERGEVRLVIYNMLGEEVKELYRGEQDAGEYSVEFNANGLPSGVYMCRMEAGRFIKTIKMMLMK